MKFTLIPSLLALSLVPSSAIPSTPYYFTQLSNHFDESTTTYLQRYYKSDTHFDGPGHPIFLVMGGEGDISPKVG